MPRPKIYFFRREHEHGYDQITFIAWYQSQANELLREAVKKPEEWEYFMCSFKRDEE